MKKLAAAFLILGATNILAQTVPNCTSNSGAGKCKGVVTRVLATNTTERIGFVINDTRFYIESYGTNGKEMVSLLMVAYASMSQVVVSWDAGIRQQSDIGGEGGPWSLCYSFYSM